MATERMKRVKGLRKRRKHRKDQGLNKGKGSKKGSGRLTPEQLAGTKGEVGAVRAADANQSASAREALVKPEEKAKPEAAEFQGLGPTKAPGETEMTPTRGMSVAKMGEVIGEAGDAMKSDGSPWTEGIKTAMQTWGTTSKIYGIWAREEEMRKKKTLEDAALHELANQAAFVKGAGGAAAGATMA